MATKEAIQTFARNALKEGSACAAIRATTAKFKDATRAELIEALTGLKLNIATVKTQIQLGKNPPKPAAKKAAAPPKAKKEKAPRKRAAKKAAEPAAAATNGKNGG
jgi:hypothetical protein